MSAVWTPSRQRIARGVLPCASPLDPQVLSLADKGFTWQIIRHEATVEVRFGHDAEGMYWGASLLVDGARCELLAQNEAVGAEFDESAREFTMAALATEAPEAIPLPDRTVRMQFGGYDLRAREWHHGFHSDVRVDLRVGSQFTVIEHPWAQDAWLWLCDCTVERDMQGRRSTITLRDEGVLPEGLVTWDHARHLALFYLHAALAGASRASIDEFVAKINPTWEIGQ